MLLLNNDKLYYQNDNERVLLKENVFDYKNIEQCNIQINYICLQALNCKNFIDLFNCIHSISLYFRTFDTTLEIEFNDYTNKPIVYTTIIKYLYNIEVINIDLIPNYKLSNKSNVKCIIKIKY